MIIIVEAVNNNTEHYNLNLYLFVELSISITLYSLKVRLSETECLSVRSTKFEVCSIANVYVKHRDTNAGVDEPPYISQQLRYYIWNTRQ